MRTGLSTVYSPSSVSLGAHVDTWEGDEGRIAYGYDRVVVDEAPETVTGAAATGTPRGSLEPGDLVRVDNIPVGHRKHTHRIWALGPIRAIYAVPRDKRETEDGRVETVELDPSEFDPKAPESWPGIAVVCDVHAPKLGGDVPLSQCSLVSELPDAYVERYGDSRTQGMWVREPIRKNERMFNNDHLPDPEEDDREPEYIWTGGEYDTYVQMRRDMYALPADDPNADPDNPETSRPYQVSIESGHLSVELLDGTGEERMRDVASEYGATIELVEEIDRSGSMGADVTQRYRVTVEGESSSN